jgi:fatty acid desaturase
MRECARLIIAGASGGVGGGWLFGRAPQWPPLAALCVFQGMAGWRALMDVGIMQ